MRLPSLKPVAALLATAVLLVTAAAPGLAADPTPAPTSTTNPNDPPPIAGRPEGSETTGQFIGITADDGATVVAQKILNERMADITVRSPAVGVELPVRIIVPPGWTPDATATWPVAIGLHGGNGDYRSWTGSTTIEALSKSWGVIVAMPEAGITGAYTDYVQTTKFGPLKWETFHTVELLQILERGFHASRTRAIFGLSAGGYGALDYAARHPGMFRFAASYSGLLGVNQWPQQPLLLSGDQIVGTGYARYGVPLIDQRNWDAHDPFKLVKNLKGTSLYISSGLTGFPSADDTVGWGPLQFFEALAGSQAQSLVGLLKQNDIPVTAHLYTYGEHDWVAWRRELPLSWPQMMQAIGAQPI